MQKVDGGGRVAHVEELVNDRVFLRGNLADEQIEPVVCGGGVW